MKKRELKAEIKRLKAIIKRQSRFVTEKHNQMSKIKNTIEQGREE